MPRGRIVSLLALCVLSAAILPAQPSSDAATRWDRQIKQAEEKGDLALYREALKTAETFPPDDVRLFETLVKVAEVCQDEDEDCDNKSTGYLDRAIKTAEKIKNTDLHLSDLLADLGKVASGEGRHDDALNAYGRAREIRERLLGPTDAKVAATYADIAWQKHYKKEDKEARTIMEFALGIHERVKSIHGEDFADLLDRSAQLYQNSKNWPAAENEYERSIAIRRALFKETDPRLVEALQTIALRTQYGEGKEFAEKLFREIASIQKHVHTERSEEYYQAQINLGNVLRLEKRYSDAETAIGGACALRERMGKEDQKLAHCLERAGRLQSEQENYSGAETTMERSIALYTKLEQLDPKTNVEYSLLGVQGFLAETYLKDHKQNDAEKTFLAFRQRAMMRQQRFLADTADEMSQIYEKQGNLRQAAEKLEITAATIEATNRDDSRMPQYLSRLSQLYLKLGRTEDANRVAMESMNATFRIAGKEAATNKNFKQGLAIVLAVMFGLPVLFGGVSVFVYWFLQRKVTRNIEALYRPEPVPPPLPLGAVASEIVSVEEPIPSPLPLEEVAPEPVVFDEAAIIAEPVSFSKPVPPPLPVFPETASEETASEPAATEQMTFEGLSQESPAENDSIAVPPPLPTLPIAPPSPQSPVISRVSLRAEGEVVFAMRVVNLLLSLLTLGIYSFWGKAKVRRYVMGQAEYQGDRFAFHGTGRELLLGWLRALPALGVVFLLPNVLPVVWQSRASILVAQGIAMLAIMILWPLARVGAYRYRMNRMSWRGIRFSYRGSTLRYLLETLGGLLLSSATLGIYWPFLETRQNELMWRDTYYGNGRFQFSGRGRDLAGAWIFALPMSICSFGIGWAWWSALRSRYYWAHTTFEGSRFRCTATGWKLLRLWVGNFFIVVLTLGLGMSWAMLRTLRFWCEHVQAEGEPALETIRQDQQAATAMGESFADFLGFDFGF